MVGKISYMILKINLFLVFLHSLGFYPLWNFRLGLLQIICAFSFLLSNQRKELKLTSKSILISSFFLICLLFFNGGLDDLSKFVGAFFFSLNVLFILSLKDDTKNEIFNFFLKGMAIILAPSIVVFILVLTGFGFPNLGLIVHPQHEFYFYFNYIFVLIGTYGVRFNSVFCEPGHLGMIIAMMLFVDNYKFKNATTIILVLSLILTLSLAGYLLLLGGYFLRNSIVNFKQIVKKGLIALILILLLLVVVYQIGGKDNIVTELIIDRLEYNEDSGSISGDNRISNKTERIFNEMSLTDLWFGMNNSEYKMLVEYEIIAGAGYKLFIMENGIIAILAVFILYLSLVSYSKNKKLGYLLLLLYSISFIQRSSVFWSSMLFTFILAQGIFNLSYTEEHNKNKLI